MKKLFPVACASLVLMASCAQVNKSGEMDMAKHMEQVSLSTKLDSVSYSIGADVGANLKKSDFDEVSYDAFMKGMFDAQEGDSMEISPVQQQAMIRAFFQEIQEQKGQAVKVEGEKFLAENAKKEGIQVTASGLQYEVITEGTGPKPTADNTVKCHYHGTLIDGTVFDSSVDRGTPAEFPLKGVIPGWTEGVPLMSVGSKYRFYIPQELAYGANPRPGGPIKPYMALIFDIELIEIVK